VSSVARLQVAGFPLSEVPAGGTALGHGGSHWRGSCGVADGHS